MFQTFSKSLSPIAILPAASLIACGLLVCGCGGPKDVNEDSRASASISFSEGRELLEEGRYREAEPAFRAAMEGTLQPDMIAEVAIGLARCLAGQGNVDEALGELERNREGFPDDAVYHVARGQAYLENDDSTNAQVEFRKARQINVKVRIPEVR